jgi:phosphoribosylformylglycinamidine (FGAM) synthase-like amidotransferase family enzyme
MYTTYHLESAQEVSTDILDAIKATFKSKPITITVEEDDSDFELTADMKNVLEERLEEGEGDFLSSEESIKQLNKKYYL